MLCLYQFSFTMGALSFAFATISSLPIFEDTTAFVVFTFLIRLAACFMAASEMLELIAAPIPMWRNQLCALALVGQVLYLWSADSGEHFNSGEGYLLAALCTSISS
jgi:hypothetical protein